MPVAEALEKLLKRGVLVRVVVDEKKSRQLVTDYVLAGSGVPVRKDTQ